MTTDDPTSDLPPRPGPETGQPVPSDAPTQMAEGGNDKRPSSLPAPPPGYGPPLAQFREKRYLLWLGGLIPVALLAADFIAYSGPTAIKIWPLWIILAAFYAWTVFVHWNSAVTAGADWVMCRKDWVNTYELTKIHYRIYDAKSIVSLSDNERTVEIRADLLENDRTLWNYVYLGLLHSAAKGAELDPTAQGVWPELAAASRNARSHAQRRNHRPGVRDRRG